MRDCPFPTYVTHEAPTVLHAARQTFNGPEMLVSRTSAGLSVDCIDYLGDDSESVGMTVVTVRDMHGAMGEWLAMRERFLKT